MSAARIGRRLLPLAMAVVVAFLVFTSEPLSAKRLLAAAIASAIVTDVCVLQRAEVVTVVVLPEGKPE